VDEILNAVKQEKAKKKQKQKMEPGDRKERLTDEL